MSSPELSLRTIEETISKKVLSIPQDGSKPRIIQMRFKDIDRISGSPKEEGISFKLRTTGISSDCSSKTLVRFDNPSYPECDGYYSIYSFEEHNHYRRVYKFEKSKTLVEHGLDGFYGDAYIIKVSFGENVLEDVPERLLKVFMTEKLVIVDGRLKII